MHSGLQSLICGFTQSQISDSMHQNLDQHKDSIERKGGISEVEIPDGWNAVSHWDDRGDTQAGFCVQNDSEGKDEKPQDVKNDS